MSIIAITRHGKYLREGNDGHLTKEGICEVRSSANALKRHLREIKTNLDHIFHSPLIRSKETAGIFQEIFASNQIQVQVIEESRIADPKMDLDIHFAMVKSPICNPKQLSTGQVYGLMRQPAGFETYNEVAFRFSSFMRDLICSLGNGDKEGVVVVTHAPAPDYLLLQHFKTGLCYGVDFKYGEFLRIYQTGNNFEINFREKKLKVDAKKLLFDRDKYLKILKGGCDE